MILLPALRKWPWAFDVLLRKNDMARFRKVPQMGESGKTLHRRNKPGEREAHEEAAVDG